MPDQMNFCQYLAGAITHEISNSCGAKSAQGVENVESLQLNVACRILGQTDPVSIWPVYIVCYLFDLNLAHLGRELVVKSTRWGFRRIILFVCRFWLGGHYIGWVLSFAKVVLMGYELRKKET